MKRKLCPRCNKSKTLMEYHLSRQTLDGYHSICKTCRCAYNSKVMREQYYPRTRGMVRNIVLELLGNKCKRCGFRDKRALQIDHIIACGSKGRLPSNALMSRIIRDETYRQQVQLLCANCNWIKRAEKNETAAGHRLKDQKFKLDGDKFPVESAGFGMTSALEQLSTITPTEL